MWPKQPEVKLQSVVNCKTHVLEAHHNMQAHDMMHVVVDSSHGVGCWPHAELIEQCRKLVEQTENQ